MKQHITKKQWDELSVNHQFTFCGYDPSGKPNKKEIMVKHWFSFGSPSIGQMIEFLGEDLKRMEKDEDGLWTVRIERNNVAYNCRDKELCDVLREAVKHKLSTKSKP